MTSVKRKNNLKSILASSVLSIVPFCLDNSYATEFDSFSNLEKKLDGNKSIVIKDIVVVGSVKLSDVGIIEYLTYKVGDKVGKDYPNEVIKKLYSIGTYENVGAKLTKEGVLKIFVTESKVINRVAFENNFAVEDDDLKNFVGLGSNSVITKTKIADKLKKIKSYYKVNGYFSAKVKAKTIERDDYRVDLVFEIEEGPFTAVKNINFIGNTVFDSEKLKSKILTKETHFFSGIADDDIYDDAKLIYDEELLRRFYADHGYLNFKIVDKVVSISSDKSEFTIDYVISEGRKFFIRNVYDSALPLFKKGKGLNEYNEIVKKVKSADIYNSKKITNIVVDMNELISEKGIEFNEIVSNYKLVTFDKISKDAKFLEKNNFIVKDNTVFNQDGEEILFVDINVVNRKLSRKFIRNINIKGNTRTIDSVIRNEILTQEGDAFHHKKLKNIKSDVSSIGYFSSVDVKEKVVDSEGQEVDIDVTVDEKSTGKVSLGIGYSSATGNLFNIGISEKNFLGTGKGINFNIEKSDDNILYKAGLSDRNVFAEGIDGSVAVSKNVIDNTNSSGYKSTDNAVNGSLGFDLNSSWYLTNTLGFKKRKISDVSSTANAVVIAQSGNYNTTTIGSSLVYNDLDHHFNPTSGSKVSFTARIGGIGSEYRFNKFDFSWYHVKNFGDDHILNSSYNLGFIRNFSDVLVGDRYFLSQNIIRGLSKSGPYDALTGNFLGGTTFASINYDYDFPIGLPRDFGVKGVLFLNNALLTDVPQNSGVVIVDDKKFKHTWGLGVKWASPVGPMRFDYSSTIKKSANDEEDVFYFSLGFGI